MKCNRHFILLFFLIPILAVSCNTGASEESTEDTAEDINEEIIGWRAEEDAEFITEAYSFNLMLQQYGEMAQQRENIPASVTDFAKTSAEYHKDQNIQLAAMAEKSGIALPIEVGENVRNYMEELREKDTDAFANAYIDVVDDIHAKMIRAYEDASENAHDTSIKNWANAELITIRDHEALVDQLETITNEME